MDSTPLAPRSTPTQSRRGASRVLSVGTIVTLLAILVLGLALRWDRLEYAEFTNDQAWPLSRAREIVTEGARPVTGFSSSLSTAHGPVELYLLAIPAAISPDPRVATAFVGLLQMGAVALTYLLGKIHFGRSVGLLAALFYAVNPWAIYYARKMWTPNMTPLLSALFFLCLFAAVARRSRAGFVLAPPVYALLFLTHPSAVVFAPLLLLAYLAMARRAGPRQIFLSAGLALLVASPYLYNDFTHGFPSLRGYLGASGSQARVDLDSAKYVLTLASGRYFPNMTGIGLRGDWHLLDLALVNDTVSLLLLLGLAYCLWQVIGRRSNRSAYALLGCWLALPIAMSIRHSMELFPHYFLVAYPVQFLLVAVGLSAVGRSLMWASRRVRLAVPLLGLLIVGAVGLGLGLPQAIFARQYVDYLQSNGPLGPYGPPLTFSQRAVDTARQLSAETGAERVYVYSYLQQQALDYLARPNLSLRHVDPPSGIVLPAVDSVGALAVLASDEIPVPGRAYNLVADDSSTIAGLRAQGFSEREDARIVGPDGHNYYRFFHRPAVSATGRLDEFVRPENPPRLANGMVLVGHSFPGAANDGNVAFSLLWQLPQAPTEYVRREYNLFVHLVDGTGRILAQRDYELFGYMQWREGDLLVTTHRLQMAEQVGPTRVFFNVGAYSRFDRADVPWQDASGGGIKPVHTLGPAKVAPHGTPEAPAFSTLASFGEEMRLLGYDLPSVSTGSGHDLEVRLHWQAQSRVGKDYTVSLQVLDLAGRLVAQHDSPPAGGEYPTSLWDVGEVILDSHSINLPSDLTPGRYGLRVVAYDSKTHTRLRVGESDFVDIGIVELR